jgi:hypothetical protein
MISSRMRMTGNFTWTRVSSLKFVNVKRPNSNPSTYSSHVSNLIQFSMIQGIERNGSAYYLILGNGLGETSS